MQEINQKISLLIDDELDSRQAQRLLQEIQHDPELQATLQRYQLLGQALKYKQCQVLDKQFAAKIHQQISQEPSYLLPSAKPVTVVKPNRFSVQKAGLALAASILLAIMWLTSNQAYQQAPLPSLVFMAPQQDVPAGMSPRLNEYLQAHDNTLYSSQTGRVQPYARVVGFHQE